MKKKLHKKQSRPWFGLLAILICLLSGFSCNVDPQTIQILGTAHLAPGNCNMETGTTRYQTNGLFDLNLTNQYFLTLQVRSNLVSMVNLEEYRLEPNDAFLVGAEVELTYHSNTYTLPPENRKFFIHMTGYLAVGSTGWINGVEVVPSNVGSLLSYDNILDIDPSTYRTLMVRVRLKFNLARDSEQFSSWFQFPVRVCKGCLFHKPASVSNCNQAVFEDPANCYVGQDEDLECRYYCAISPTYSGCR